MKLITRRGIILWVLCALFVIGIIILTASLVKNGSVWVMKSYNRHVYSNSQLIAAGDITDCNGTVLSKTEDGERVYSSDRDTRLATLHAVGDKTGFISTGIQTEFKSELVGYNILNGVYSIKQNGGNDIELTIDADICKTALSALGSYKGTIAVANYLTGDIICMVSTPTYDVNNIPSNLTTSDEYDGVFINRFLTGLYTPGSTFKLVTAISAIENFGPDIVDSTYTCDGILDVDGIEEDNIICNATHGTLTFEQALAKSCNSSFAQIAIKLGAGKLRKTATDLGFKSSFTINGKIDTAESLFSLKKSAADATVGWTGIGQGDTLITPASMLRLMCAIANGGKAVSFNLVSKITDSSGISINYSAVSAEDELMDSETASIMKDLMRNNVKTQYGDYNYSGLSLCAKSGTAQIDDVTAHNTAWFVGFMDDEDNPYAFVVVAEYGNSGSQTAGPMANKVLQAIVSEN